MARKPRIHYPGAIYHVMLRGNAKQAIFHKDEEYRYFENILAQGLERNSVRLHAYCWMKNHVHMALQVKDKPLSKLMQNIAQRLHTGSINGMIESGTCSRDVTRQFLWTKTPIC